VRPLERPHPVRRLLRAFVSADSYGLVVLLILVSYCMAVSFTGPRSSGLVLFVQIATVWFALRTSRVHRATLRVAVVLMAVAGVAGIIGVALPDASPVFVVGMGTVLYLLAPFAIVRHLTRRGGVDQEAMLGAVAAYLLAGMFFAFLYRTIGEVQTTPFFGAGGDGTMAQVLFFSFVTLTTTGYGNLVPADNPGQTAAVIEMINGQLFLIIGVGKLVSEWRPPRWRTEQAGREGGK
jgi:hypothetical protein